MEKERGGEGEGRRGLSINISGYATGAWHGLALQACTCDTRRRPIDHRHRFLGTDLPAVLSARPINHRMLLTRPQVTDCTDSSP